MNKKMLILLFCIFITYAFSYASEIKIAPIAVYDSDGNKITNFSSPSKTIYEELGKHWTEGLVKFSAISEKKHSIPATIIDANKIATAENADYLIYGYIKKSEANWFAEIKLYDKAGKKIIKEFFSSDSLEHYDRLMDILCQNIFYGIEEITGFSQDKLKEKTTRPMELRIPVSLFYWTPVDTTWRKTILGIAGINTGAEFYPSQPLIVSNGKLMDFSARFNLSWNAGINQKESYPLMLNTIALSIPVVFHIHFNECNSLYFGTGIAYGVEFLKIRPKYDDEQFSYQNAFSFELIAGYEFNINKTVSFFAEIKFDWHLAKDGFVSVKTCLGSSFNIFKR